MQLSASWIGVDIIRKPAFRLSIETDRHVYVARNTVKVTAAATFYDGTPVPALEVGLADQPCSYAGTKTTLTSDATGRATATYVASGGLEGRQTCEQTFRTYPARGEEDGIWAATGVVVLASSVLLDGEAVLTGRRLSVGGKAYNVDLDKAERTFKADPWGGGSADARGTAAGGLPVTVKVVRLVWVRKSAGQTYDFIAKKVVQLYDYSRKDIVIATRKLATGADGAYSLGLTVPDPQGDYTVTISASDSMGRTTTIEPWVEGPPPAPDRPEHGKPYVEIDPTGATTPSPDEGECWLCRRYGVGETVRVVMRDGVGTLPSGGSNAYLFLTEQRGLRSASVQASSHFAIAFDRDAPPNLVITAVRFTGTTYQAVPQGFTASFKTDQRRLTVTLTPNAQRYRPGDAVSLDVATSRTDDGAPVVATVTLAAVDQKLFDIEAASEHDPLADLYTRDRLGRLVDLRFAPVAGLHPGRMLDRRRRRGATRRQPA